MVAESVSTKTTWAIDKAHSGAEFSVKYMMFTNAKGRFAELQGTLELDSADVTKSSVDVVIDVSSISTNDEKRDGHLKSGDFFDAETFPTITFKSTRVESVGSDRLKVTGDLTIRDVTRPVVLDTTSHGQAATPFGTTIAAFSAETSISRKDFGLVWNVALETGGVMVGDNVKIALEIEGVKQ